MKFAVLIALIVITIIYLKYNNDKKKEHFIGYNLNDKNVFRRCWEGFIMFSLF